MNEIKITASTHPAKNNILQYIKDLEEENVDIDMLHVDIMDGVFVEDKTFLSDMVKEIYKSTTYPLDVHLMVHNPMEVVPEYVESGANIITVHYEAFNDENDIIKVLKYIREKDCLAGISINPKTRVSQIFSLLQYVDLVLIMSVEPGKSGQKFIPFTINKISSLKQVITQNKLNIKIEVDGGINIETIGLIKSAGADMAVCGSALFRSTERKNLIKILKNIE